MIGWWMLFGWACWTVVALAIGWLLGNRRATRRAVRVLNEEFLAQRDAKLHSPTSILMLNRVESRVLRNREWPETWEGFFDERREHLRKERVARVAYDRCQSVHIQLGLLVDAADAEARLGGSSLDVGATLRKEKAEGAREAYGIAFHRLRKALEVEDQDCG